MRASAQRKRPPRQLVILTLIAAVVAIWLLDKLPDPARPHSRRQSGAAAAKFSVATATDAPTPASTALIQSPVADPITPRRIVLRVAPAAYQQITEVRNAAMARGVLLVGEEDFVPATIDAGDGPYAAEIRLKGDKSDHWATDKWSFRVHLDGRNTILGMRKFSLQSPATRNFLHEWVYHQAVARESVIALRYDFVHLFINDRDLGVYALEEHFDQRLLENNRRRSGPILKFNERLFWANQHREYLNDNAYFTSLIDGFELNRIQRDPALRALFDDAVTLLTAFRRGELPADQVFDVDVMGRYYAISDLTGSHHMNFHNLRFYFNPLTAKFEPIAFDGNSGTKIYDVSGNNRRYTEAGAMDFDRALFKNRSLIERYHHHLQRISDRGYLQNLIADIEPQLRAYETVIRHSYPDFQYSWETLEHNHSVIGRVLQPLVALQAYYEGHDEGAVRIVLATIQPMPLTVESLQLDELTLQPVAPIWLNGKSPTGPIETVHASFSLPPTTPWPSDAENRLQINCTIAGTYLIRRERVTPWSPFDLSSITSTKPTTTLRSGAGILHVDEATKTVSFVGRRVVIDQDVLIPDGFRLYVSAGTDIEMQNGAALISCSPVVMSGTVDAPINVHSEDQSAGLFVIGAAGESTLAHVVFQGLRAPDLPPRQLTGAVTFYESDVTLDQCRFLAADAEDALNIVRSTFKIDTCLFSHSRSDAIDVDFAKGTLSHCTFRDCGNDAIDVSGSYVELASITIVRARDKGISAGERSTVKADQIQIDDSSVAIASKDLSIVRVTDTIMRGCKVGIAVYQKKAEFGRAYCIAERLTITDTDMPHLVEKNSVLVIDQRRVPAVKQKIAKLLYGEVLN